MRTGILKGSRSEAGFTLVELVLVCVILPVVLGAAYLVMQAMSTNYNTIQTRADATGDTQRVLDTMVRELRQGQEIAEGGGAFAVATPTRCTFYSDIDHNGVPDRVSYYVSNGSLYRVVGKAGISVYPYNFVDQTPVDELDLGGASSSIFTYYDSGVPPQLVTSSTLMNTIAVVAMNLQCKRTSQAGMVSVGMSTQVKIRSLFNSLD
jgi:prepilin-type N-terminal cleavage/methylation domain-containing protein